ncbi:MAG: hypothetical protein LC637_09980 [Xanthomonadaceae bacterium]|nr:hypothetical protein [Xanthomonadaceae bacterium]
MSQTQGNASADTKKVRVQAALLSASSKLSLYVLTGVALVGAVIVSFLGPPMLVLMPGAVWLVACILVFFISLILSISIPELQDAGSAESYPKSVVAALVILMLGSITSVFCLISFIIMGDAVTYSLLLLFFVIFYLVPMIGIMRRMWWVRYQIIAVSLLTAIFGLVVAFNTFGLDTLTLLLMGFYAHAFMSAWLAIEFAGSDRVKAYFDRPEGGPDLAEARGRLSGRSVLTRLTTSLKGMAWLPMTVLVMALVSVVYVGIASLAGVKVMVEVDNPQEEDFVVVCRWYGSSFSLHGAPLDLLKEKPFLARAGEIVDCGWTAWSLWPGSDVAVSVYHPVYRPAGGSRRSGLLEPWAEWGSVKDATGREVQVIVVRPRTYQAWIDEVVAEYSGKGELTDFDRYAFSIELDKRAYGLLNNFARSSEYFKYYLEAVGSPPVIRTYRARYESRMLGIVNHAAGAYKEIEGRKRKSELLTDPERTMDEWWEILEKRVR